MHDITVHPSRGQRLRKKIPFVVNHRQSDFVISRVQIETQNHSACDPLQTDNFCSTLSPPRTCFIPVTSDPCSVRTYPQYTFAKSFRLFPLRSDMTSSWRGASCRWPTRSTRRGTTRRTPATAATSATAFPRASRTCPRARGWRSLRCTSRGPTSCTATRQGENAVLMPNLLWFQVGRVRGFSIACLELPAYLNAFPLVHHVWFRAPL